MGVTRQIFIATGVTAFADHAHARERSQVIQILVDVLHVNQHVIVNQLSRISGKVHKDHVSRIGRHKKMSVAVRCPLIQAPTHRAAIPSSRFRHIRIGFHKEILTQVNRRNHFGGHILSFDMGLNLYNAGATEYEDRLGVGIVSTTVSTFQAVDQDLGSDRFNHLLANLSAHFILVGSSYFNPSRIGKHAEISFLAFILAFRIRTFAVIFFIVVVLFATAALVVRIGKEGSAFAVPNNGRQLVVTASLKIRP